MKFCPKSPGLARRKRSLSAIPRYCVGLMQRTSTWRSPAGADQRRRPGRTACWCSIRGSGRCRGTRRLGAAGSVDLHLGVDRLADLALGGPVDVERHLERDRRRVQGRSACWRSSLGLVGVAGLLGGVALASRSSACGLELLRLGRSFWTCSSSRVLSAVRLAPCRPVLAGPARARRGDPVFEDHRVGSASSSIVPALSSWSTGIRRSSDARRVVRVGTRCPNPRSRVAGVAPSMWLAELSMLLADVDPLERACSLASRGRSSEPLTGNRADILVRSCSACSRAGGRRRPAGSLAP